MSTTEHGSQGKPEDQPEEGEGAQHQEVEAQARRRAGTPDEEAQSEGWETSESGSEQDGARAEGESEASERSQPSGEAQETERDGSDEDQEDGARSESQDRDEAKADQDDEAQSQDDGEAKSEDRERSEDSGEEDSDDHESGEDQAESGADRGTRAKTLAEMIVSTKNKPGTALKFKTADGEWDEVSYNELAENLQEVAKGLIALGIEHGDRVAIFSDTRPDWTLCDLATICTGAVVAPIYQTSSADEAKHVLSDSESKLVFCESSEMVDKVEQVRDDCPSLEHIVVIEGDRAGAMSLNDLRDKGQDVDDEQFDERVEGVSPDDLFTIVYTSGTTGPPKGCLLTHGNYRANIEQCEAAADWGEAPTLLLFLPLAHVLTRILQMVILDVGGTLAYWEQDKDKIIDNLQEVEPTHFSAVPRIFEKIYGRATAEATGLKGKAFWKAVDIGRRTREDERAGKQSNPVLQAEYLQADKHVLSKVRNLFGGNLQFAATGAAPVQKEMLEFFDACGVLVLEGYGATETSAVATINQPEDFRFGTVGKPLPGSEVKIGEEDGEILIRGPHVFQGYHGMEEETKEDLDDEGWYHTGDIGELDDDNFLSITGRKKDIIVTSSGKNIPSGYIENKIAASRWVSHAVVYGDDKPYLVALVTLDQEERNALLEEAGSSDGDDIANDESVRQEIQKAIDGANDDLARVEQVKKFAIVDRELSQEEGEITPTMKVKRNVVYENYESEFEGLYDDEDEG
jgi:long-chain acyl-CoA synthetase